MGSHITYDNKNDLYDVLGVKADTDAKKIKLAYYKMAQKYHPDKAGDDLKALEKFKSISNAYEVLVDEAQRKQYDKLRMEFKQGGQYHSRKSNTGQTGSANQYTHRRGHKRDAQDDFFYGGFKSKEDFYGFYSDFGKGTSQGPGQKNSAGNTSQGRTYQERHDGSSQDFYKTNTSSQKRDQKRANSHQENSFQGGFSSDDPFGGTTFNSRQDRAERERDF